MFGDIPPAIVALDGPALADKQLPLRIQRELGSHAVWIVTPEPEAVRDRLAELGLSPDGPGLQVLAGGPGDAVSVARERGANLVRLWCDFSNAEAVPMEVRVAAHDAGIQLRLEAPFASGAEAA